MSLEEIKKGTRNTTSLSEYCFINKDHRRELWCDNFADFSSVNIRNKIASSAVPAPLIKVDVTPV